MEALAPIAAQLGIDQTFYYLFGLVVVFYAILSVTYLKPFQHLLHDRKLKTAGAKKEAEELKAQAEQAMNQYKARLKDVTDKARQTVRQNEEDAKKEESKILGEASVKAKASIQNTQRELEAQRKASIDSLNADISGLASEIASKVMGRPVSPR